MALKIYVFDMGWPGSIVLTAETKEEALKRILEVDPYKTPAMNDVEEHELEGFLTYNMGDQ